MSTLSAVLMITSLVLLAAVIVFGILYMDCRKELHECSKDLVTVKENCDRIVASEKEKTEFAASMGHEIRTPMNAITCAVDLLSKEVTSPTQETYLSILKSSSSTLMDIVNDILDFSKMTSGNMALSEAPYNVCNLMNALKEDMAIRLRDKNIAYTTDVDFTMPRELVGDELRIKQILMNLLTNAAKFTVNGEIKVSVSYERVAKEMLDVTFAVSDTGSGITPQDREKLFENFSGNKKNKRTYVEGSGLGLNICRQLTELMGGTLSVESEFGRGSTFYARIRQRVANNDPIFAPRKGENAGCLVWEDNKYYKESLLKMLSQMGMSVGRVEDMSDLEATISSVKTDYLFVMSRKLDAVKPIIARISPSTCIIGLWEKNAVMNPSDEKTAALKVPFILCDVKTVLEDVSTNRALGISDNIVFTAPSARVLVVDDNKVNLKVAAALIKTFEVQTISVDNGYDAVDLIKNGEKFDLIFMDHMMPGMDGVQTTVKIHELEERETRTPIVALTANTGSEIEKQFYEAGMCDFLPKPIVIKQINYILEKWLPKNKQVHTIVHAVESEEIKKDEKLFVPESGLANYWNDTSIYSEVLKTFLEKSSVIIHRIFDEEEYDEKVKNVYSLGKVSASIGADAFLKEIDNIKDLAKVDNSDTFTNRLDKLRDDYKRLSKEINEYIDSLPKDEAPELLTDI